MRSKTPGAQRKSYMKDKNDSLLRLQVTQKKSKPTKSRTEFKCVAFDNLPRSQKKNHYIKCEKLKPVPQLTKLPTRSLQDLI